MANGYPNFRSEALVFIYDLLEGDVVKKISQAVVNAYFNEQKELSSIQQQIAVCWRKNLLINGFPNPLNFKKIGKHRLSVSFSSELKKRNSRANTVMDFWAEIYPEEKEMFLEAYSDKLFALRKMLHQSEPEPISEVLERLRELAMDFSQSVRSDSGLSREEIVILAVMAGFEELEDAEVEEKANTDEIETGDKEDEKTSEPASFQSLLANDILRLVEQEKLGSDFWDDVADLIEKIQLIATTKKNQHIELHEKEVAEQAVKSGIEKIFAEYASDMKDLELNKPHIYSISNWSVSALNSLLEATETFYIKMSDYRDLYGEKPTGSAKRIWRERLSDAEDELRHMWAEFETQLCLNSDQQTDVFPSEEHEHQPDRLPEAERTIEVNSESAEQICFESASAETVGRTETTDTNKEPVEISRPDDSTESASKALGHIVAIEKLKPVESENKNVLRPVDASIKTLSEKPIVTEQQTTSKVESSFEEMCLAPARFPEAWLILKAFQAEAELRDNLKIYPTEFMLEIGYIVYGEHDSLFDRQLRNPKLQQLLAEIVDAQLDWNLLSAAQRFGCLALALPIHFVHGIDSLLVDIWLSPGEQVPTKVHSMIDVLRQFKGKIGVASVAQLAQKQKGLSVDKSRQELKALVLSMFERNGQLKKKQKPELWDRLFPRYGKSELLHWVVDPVIAGKPEIPKNYLSRLQWLEVEIADDAARKILGSELDGFARKMLVRELDELRGYASMWAKTFENTDDGFVKGHWEQFSSQYSSHINDWKDALQTLPPDMRIAADWMDKSLNLIKITTEG